MAARVPKLCHHKASGHAYATLGGKPVFFGRWGDPETRERYDRAIAAWLAAGRKNHQPPPPGLPLEEALLRYKVQSPTTASAPSERTAPTALPAFRSGTTACW